MYKIRRLTKSTLMVPDADSYFRPGDQKRVETLTPQLKGFLDAGLLEIVDPWESFIRLWWTSFKDKPTMVKDLLSFCISNHFLQDILGSGSVKSRQSILGRLLNKNVGPCGERRLVRRRKREGTFYHLS